MRVLMVDDHVMFLQGLKNLLSVMAPELHVDAAETLERALFFISTGHYGLVLLDWHLAECEGEDAIPQIREAGCVAPIVVLSGENSLPIIHRAVGLGAAGFIPKKYSSEKMISALTRILSGGVFLPSEEPVPPQAPIYVSPDVDPRMANLTQRQRDVYRAAIRGLPNKLIARELGIASSTVKTHLAAVFAALGVHSRTEAAFQASREGMHLFDALHQPLPR